MQNVVACGLRTMPLPHDGGIDSNNMAQMHDTPFYDALVPVMSIGNAALVPFVDSVLQQSGLEFFISGDRVQDLFGWGRIGTGFNVITGPPVVHVRARDVEEARELLRDVETTRHLSMGLWVAILVFLFLFG